MPTLTELNLYPIKSCAGITLREAVLSNAGLTSQLIYDREWMVVDGQGNFLSQRSHPKMALITPRIKADTLELRAPGMMRLEIPLGLPDPQAAPTLQVSVWEDRVKAYDCDAVTATWFSSFLGLPCRLARFHPDAERLANMQWTGGIAADTLFADGYPILLISLASLKDLNQKHLAVGRAALPMNRFRPNIVIDGIAAFEEDYAASITIGNVILKPVKPCSRCSMPSVDQASGVPGPDPLDIMQGYRANPKLDGQPCFGMNVIVQAGEGETLGVGQSLEVNLAF